MRWDFAGDRTGNFRMIPCEVQSHDALARRAKLFGAKKKFFGVIADANARNFSAPTWSPEIEDPWQKLLGEIEGVVQVNRRALPSCGASRASSFWITAVLIASSLRFLAMTA